jgi:hypothetical protein
LRDVFITEYGIADLRGKSDSECVAAMLAIADSRFQSDLLRQAKDAGKIRKDYEIPPRHRNNMPDTLAQALEPLRQRGLLPLFPFGTDLTATEQRLVPALALLNDASRRRSIFFSLLIEGLFSRVTQDDGGALARLALDAPRGLRDHLYRLLVKGAMIHVRAK